ncbi:UPF0481 protein [Salix suchowensis]|nr:UPF0481 protein [Salix suchowensis]
MNKEKIRDLVVIIQNKEKYIRSCYSEKFNRINSCDFIEMILLDAVFIIEFLKEYKHPKNFEPRMIYSFDPVKLKYTAIMLHKAGVRFQATRDKCLVNITFDKGVLKIPQVEIDYNFDRLVRNIMAMEQCLYEHEAYICSYIKFMDHLIDSVKTWVY